MLSDIRVLEISAPATMLAGQILADLGAEVVTLEPPAGAAGRRLPPFQAGPGLDSSLTWHGLNRNKRGITLDAASPDGRAVLTSLLGHFDIVIECSDGTSCLRGLPVPDSLVVCEISAFSRTGPKAGYASADAILMAAGGAPAMAGEPDRPPPFFPVPQAMMEAGAEAALAALAALTARDRFHVAQTVEVQARVATMMATLGRLVSGRSGDRASSRSMPAQTGTMPVVPGLFQCDGGWVAITVSFIPAFFGLTQGIVDWLIEEGALPAAFADHDLVAIADAASLQGACAAPIEQLIAALTETCRTKTKAQIVEISRRRRFMAAPVMTMADIAGFEHYRERGLFAGQRIGGKLVDVPARFAQFSDYRIEVRRDAPTLGQHNLELLPRFAELSDLELQALFAQGTI